MRQIFRILIFAFFLIPNFGFSQLTVEEHLAMENLNNLKVFDAKILYAKTTKEEWNGKTCSSIVISDLNGQNQINLTENEYDYDPKWSLNGRYVSFISY